MIRDAAGDTTRDKKESGEGGAVLADVVVIIALYSGATHNRCMLILLSYPTWQGRASLH